MLKTLKKAWDNENYFLMAAIVITTLVIGAVLGNPRESTFSTGRGWDTFSQLALGEIHPTEEQWGVILLFLGILQWISMWFLVNVNYEVMQGRVKEYGGLPNFRFARTVWFITCAIYVALAISFIFSNPWGISSVLLLLPAALSLRVVVRVRQTIEAAGD